MRSAERLVPPLVFALAAVPAAAQTLYPRDLTETRSSLLAGEGPYAVNSAVTRIVVEADRNDVPADGQSAVQLTVRLFGADGQPLAGSALATVEHSGGRLLLPGARTDEQGPLGRDADRVTRGIQLKVEGGVAKVTLLAPAEPQDVKVRITAGAHEANGTIAFIAEQRPMVAVGLVEGIVNFRDRTVLSPTREGDGFAREIRSWSRQFNDGKANVGARAAMFLKGTIRGDVLLTAAYDSDRDTRARLLRDIRPEEFYPVYGDSSLKSFDARTTSRLYVRLDSGKSYAMYGDFVTGDGFSQAIGQGPVASLKQRSLGQYNRSATGIRAHFGGEAITGNAFVFNDRLRQVVEEFSSQGSGPYGLANNAVLEGSEKVEVIVRDRNQTSRIVSVRPLARLADYTFEPFSGRIVLAAFLPSVDENLNPVSLRVTYEVDQGGENFWVGGVDAQAKVTENVEVGGSAVEDRNPLARYRLLSGNATFKVGENTVLVVEGAQTTSTVNTNPTNQATTGLLADKEGEVTGKAARIELAHEGERTDARVFVGRSSALFNNPAAPLNAGRDEVLLKGGVKVGESVRLYAEGLKSGDRNPGGGDRRQAGVGAQWGATERLSLDLSLREQRETVGENGTAGALSWPYDNTSGLTSGIATGSAGGALGFGNQQLDPATGLPVINQNGLSPARSSLPVGTMLSTRIVRLGAGYRATERVTLGAEAETDVSGEDRRRIAAGADVQVAERTKVYGRLERQNGWVNLQGVSERGRSANAFVVGIDSSYFRDTQAYSEYRLRDAVAGRDLQLASGLRHAWDVKEGVRMNAGVERLKVVSGTVAPVTAVSAGVDYTTHPLWRASTRVEHRRSGDIGDTASVDEKFNTTLWQGMVARKLDRDWTLLARNYLLKTSYRSRGDVLQDRAQLGVAYRDTDTNRVNALAKVEYKLEDDDSNAAVGNLRSRAIIASAHADWHPSRPWWLTGRVAAKSQRDRFENGVSDDFRAQLVAGRIVYDVTENWDIGIAAAAQFGRSSARQYAFGLEAGYLLRQNLWLSVGYNATGFAADTDLTGYEYTRRGAYIRLRFKFDEDLFKGRDPEVNRSLPR